MVKYIPTKLRKYQIIPNCFGTNRIIEKLQTILSLLIMGNTKITFLLSQELFAEEIKHSPKPTTNGVLGNHSIFFYMYGHTIDWIKGDRE